MTRRAMEEEPKSIQRRFEAAVKVIRSLPEDGSYDLSDDMLVMFYSYYKQATAGPCNTPKPNSWDPIGKAKWEAWKTLGNMPKDQAMKEYVQEIQLIIETIPLTDRMAELMDALDPFYEIVVEDDDDDDDEDAVSKAAPLSTGNTKAEKTDDDDDDDDDDAKKAEEGESEINGENEEDDMEERRTDSSTFAAGRGGLSVFNEREENSMSSSTDDAHSSLNTEEEEEELVYDDSDDVMYSDSMGNPASQEKGLGVLRVHSADVSAAGAHMQQGASGEPQCGSPDGKPLVPHPPTLGPVRTDRFSERGGRGCQLTGTKLVPDEHDNLSERSCQGSAQCCETEERADKRAFDPQIAVMLSQLQDDMQDVLHRLTTLELLKASQAEILPLKIRHLSKSPKKVALVAFKLVPYHCSTDSRLALCCALAGAVLLTEEESEVKIQFEVKTQLLKTLKLSGVVSDINTTVNIVKPH